MVHAPRRHRDRGAAIVEFAIVVPLLLALLFGVIDYGLWFNDSIGVRQDAATTVRTAVVLGKYNNTVCDSKTGMDKVACGLKQSMSDSTGAGVGRTYARVFTTGDIWARGSELVVCGMVEAKSFTGFVPLPGGGLIRSRASMSIENINPYPSSTQYMDDTDPSGEGWGWCRS